MVSPRARITAVHLTIPGKALHEALQREVAAVLEPAGVRCRVVDGAEVHERQWRGHWGRGVVLTEMRRANGVGGISFGVRLKEDWEAVGIPCTSIGS